LVDFSPGDSLLVAAAIVAFKIVANGGFIPHARQGGIGGDAEASKLDGTGLEKEQMGHTQVAFIDWGGFGDAPLEANVCVGCPLGVNGGVLCCCWIRLRFCGLGNMVILADDFKKPAWGM
jgi:hypothetical protein